MVSNINCSDAQCKHEAPKKSINLSLAFCCASNSARLAGDPLKTFSKATYPKNGHATARTRDGSQPQLPGSPGVTAWL